MARVHLLQAEDASAPAERVPARRQSSEFAGRALLVDWDGAVSVSGRFHAGALIFLQRHAERIAIVSNNSTDLPEDFSRLLARHGVRIPPDRILLAGAESLRIAQGRANGPVMLLGNRRMMAHAKMCGLAMTKTDPGLIVLLRDTQINYRRLERAANGLRSGAGLIVANPDLTHPGGDGRVTPETGALLAALLACAHDVPVKPEIVGKPAASLYVRALDALGARVEDAVMIGDNPDTDIAGARAIGMESVLVDSKTGVGSLV